MEQKNNIITKCKYESEFSKCNFPIWEKDGLYCIFHSELINEKKDKFEIEFKNILKTIENEPGKFNDINGFVFPETVKLEHIKFLSTIRISNCKFFGDICLEGCEFNSEFRIIGNIIHGNVEIKWSKFDKGFIFNWNEVTGYFKFHINFVNAVTSFRVSQIKDYFIISFSSFIGEMEIIDMKVRKALYFYGIDFSRAARTRFRNIDLTNVYFSDSKLVDIDFIGTTWKTQKNRIVIGDEIVLQAEEIPTHYPIKNIQNLKEKESIVESLYLQLCANYDKSRLFDISGKFYLSAMEMRRQSRGNWFRRNLFSWEAWYKYISLYGQSSKRAFWGIILILFLSSIIISFDPNIIQHLDNTPISDFNFKDILFIIKIFLKSVKYNLYCLIHPAEWTFQDKISLTAFVTACERIFVILLGTFFLLALRRRFRRS